MNIRPIRTDDDYEAVLWRIDALMDAVPDTPEGDELEILVTLVEAFEARRYPIESVDPVTAIRHVMAARGYTQRDFGALIGSAPRASEILNGKRDVPISAMWLLHHRWGVPAECLIRPREKARKSSDTVLARG